MPMRDGAALRSDVYLPRRTRRSPVLLERSACGRDTLDARFWTERCYAYVVQDVRGRRDSPGAFVPFEHDAADGFDSIAWMAGQDWSDGTVGTLGQSYAGGAQYQLLADSPPLSLRAAVSMGGPTDLCDGWAYSRGGALELGWVLPWALELARRSAARCACGRRRIRPPPAAHARARRRVATLAARLPDAPRRRRLLVDDQRAPARSARPRCTSVAGTTRCCTACSPRSAPPRSSRPRMRAARSICSSARGRTPRPSVRPRPASTSTARRPSRCSTCRRAGSTTGCAARERRPRRALRRLLRHGAQRLGRRRQLVPTRCRALAAVPAQSRPR
ncbi:MAG: CocE/NonD family hydrolase [Chloroflexi bacterium]|nr:CocE/NonD family hydrolase [Chloroflexota bacterium]